MIHLGFPGEEAAPPCCTGAIAQMAQTEYPPAIMPGLRERNEEFCKAVKIGGVVGAPAAPAGFPRHSPAACP